ncbi:unnamed protein product, partial [Tenebrio molitor]
VSRVLKRHRETQEYSRRPGQGRKRVTTAAQDRFLMMQTLRERLTFAQEHVNWSRAYWTNVMFSDESRYCQHSSDKRMRVYRRPGERYA